MPFKCQFSVSLLIRAGNVWHSTSSIANPVSFSNLIAAFQMSAAYSWITAGFPIQSVGIVSVCDCNAGRSFLNLIAKND